MSRDASVLPTRRALLGRRGTTGPTVPDPVHDGLAGGVAVSYWMNRLHDLDDDEDHVVTLNPRGRVDRAP